MLHFQVHPFQILYAILDLLQVLGKNQKHLPNGGYKFLNGDLQWYKINEKPP